MYLLVLAAIKMASGIYLNESIWSSPLVGYKKSKTEWSLEETRPDHAIKSSVAITKLPLGHDILKKKKKKEQQKGEL